MRKEVFLVFGLFFIVSAGVFAQNVELSENVEDFVKGLVEDTQQITEQDIVAIVKIDQNDLPDDVQIKEIEENNVGIYEVTYTKNNQTQNIFVVTYAIANLLEKETTITKNIQYLNFGLAGLYENTRFLDSATGVSLGDKGYVMLRPGSITGISTSMDLTGSGEVLITVYKNGVDTGFQNVISSEDVNKLDYDLQSEESVSYSPGDVLSVKVEQSGNVNWGNVVTIVETTS